MSRTAKDWQKAKQQAQHIRDTIHNLIDEIETLSWEHPDIIEETANKLKKTLHCKAIPLANQIIGAFTITWADEQTPHCNLCGEAAAATCPTCHKPICPNCQIIHGDFTTCSSCIPDYEHQNSDMILVVCHCGIKYNPKQHNKCPNTKNHLCKCGHPKHNHIYEEGACRPGSVCPCKIYKEAQ